MTSQQKTMLVWIGAVLGVMLVVFVGVMTKQQLNTATTSNTVSFQGEGKVLAKPDVAKLSFSILTQAATSKAAQDSNSTKSNEVTSFLKKQGVEDKDIKTTNYNIYPQQTYGINGGTPRITGYQVSQNFFITIRNLEQANKILEGVVAAGANQVDQLQFSIDKPEQLQAEAREKAIQDAKAKAKVLESQIGIDLGKIVNFQENISGMPMYYDKMVSLDGRGGGSVPMPSLPTGENEISIAVTITYQIK